MRTKPGIENILAWLAPNFCVLRNVSFKTVRDKSILWNVLHVVVQRLVGTESLAMVNNLRSKERFHQPTDPAFFHLGGWKQDFFFWYGLILQSFFVI